MAATKASYDDEFDPPRRGFFVRFCTLIVSAGLLLAPLAAAVAYLLDPILRKSQAGEQTGFVKLPLAPNLVPEDGTPVLVTIKADKLDAWNFYPNQEIGTVWVRRGRKRCRDQHDLPSPRVCH